MACRSIAFIILAIIITFIGFCITMYGYFHKPFWDADDDWCDFCKKDRENTLKRIDNCKKAGPVLLIFGFFLMIIGCVWRKQENKQQQPAQVSYSGTGTVYSSTGPITYPQPPGQNPPQGSYPPQQGSYPPSNNYPMQQTSYPPPEGGYPPQQGGYPPPQGGYQLPQGGYPPPPATYPPQQPGYQSQHNSYPPSQANYQSPQLSSSTGMTQQPLAFPEKSAPVDAPPSYEEAANAPSAPMLP